jgi:hypothetical protein
MADSLAALGLELRAEAVAWLSALTPDALPDGTAAARELFTALGALEAEVAGAAADEVELTRLQAWLTAGFYASTEPFAPADAVVAEVVEQARREADGDSADGASAGSAAGEAGGTQSVGRGAGGVASPWGGGGASSGTGGGASSGPTAGGSSGVSAGTTAGASAGTTAGVSAGTTAGVSAGTTAGVSAGTTAGMSAGTTAGVSAGTTAGVSAGTTAGASAGTTAGANEFAAGTTHRPPARTPGREIAPSSEPRRDTESERSAFVAGDLGLPKDPPPAPSHSRQPTTSSLFGNDSLEAERDRTVESADGLPRPAGGIQGLSALAALAGRGIEIPDARVDTDLPRGASDRATWEPAGSARDGTVDSGDADRADAIHPPTRSPASTEAPSAREVDRNAVRIVRIPFAPRETEDADEGWAPLPIPFLTSPGEAEDAAPGGSARAPDSEPRPPIAIPTMRVFDGLPTQPTPDVRRPGDVAEWTGFDEPAESTESFLERAARLAGARVRPAAEIVAVPAPAVPAPREEFAPAAQPLAKLAAAEPEVTPTVLVREEVAPRPVEGIDWPAADVTDLLDALASEIAHEYRRYYGE